MQLPFKANHVQLVTDCYPPSASLVNTSANYQPNPNPQELSRLTYYASNRPGKLTKLGNEIEKRVKSEARKARSGNLRSRGSMLISLSILTALANECRRDVGLLTPSLMACAVDVHEALGKDMEVASNLTTTFATWAAYSDGRFVGVDRSATQDYLSVLRYFASLCVTTRKDSEEQNRTRIIGLSALSGVVTSDALYTSTPFFREQVDVIVPALLDTLVKAGLPALLDSSAALGDNSVPSPYVTDFRTRPVAERRAASIHAHIDGEIGPTFADVTNISLRALSTLLDQCGAAQTGHAISSIFLSLDKTKDWKESDFCCWLAQNTVDWTRYQYRYVIPARLVERLVEAQGTNEELDSYFATAAMINAIFQSTTPIVNLSTSDLMSKLINFLLRRVSGSSNDRLAPPIVQCIASLGTHVYYADQIRDLASELISRLTNVEVNGLRDRAQVVEESSRSEALRYLLHALVGLMTAAPDKDIQPPDESQLETVVPPVLPRKDVSVIDTRRSTRRVPLTPEMWQDLLTLLCDSQYSVRATAAVASAQFMKLEIPRDDPYFTSLPDDKPTSSQAHGVSFSQVVLETSATSKFVSAVCAALYALVLAPSLMVLPPTLNGVETSEPSGDRRSESGLQDDSVGKSSSSRRGSLSVLESRKHTLIMRLLEQVTDTPPNASAAATGSDYANALDVLGVLFEELPSHGLLIGVPMLIALGNAVSKGKAPQNSQHRGRAEFLLRAWLKVAEVWACDDLIKTCTEKLKQLHTPCIPPSGIDLNKKTLPSAPEPLPFAEPQEVPSWESIDANGLLLLLAGCPRVHRVTGLDTSKLTRVLTAEWTPQQAVNAAFERVPSKELLRTDGITPLIKISPALMHIENLSMQSLARSSRGVAVSDLRDALDGPNNSSSAALSNSSPEKRSMQLPPPGSRSAHKARQLSGAPGEVRDVLDKLGIGKQHGNSVLKASFPAKQAPTKDTSSPSRLQAVSITP